MTAAAIMFVVGVGDLLRGARSLAATHTSDGGSAPTSRAPERATRRRTALDWALIAAAWLLAAAALLLATGLPLLSAVVAVVVAVTASVLIASPRRVLPLVGCAVVVIAIAVAVVLDTSAVAERSPIAVLLAGSALEGSSLTPSVLVIAAAALVFLGGTSNSIVRAVVGAARGSDRRAESPDRDPESWQLLRRGRELAVVRKSQAVPASSGFRGGRIVGPLERVLVFAALLAAVPVVIAGLVAAKGVVRFPEISADRDGGAKAEEFLVGTLCSLLLAALAALVVLVRSG